MKIDAVAIQVKGRPYTNKMGVTSTYYDAVWMDAEPDIMKRFPGQLFTKPSTEEVKDHNIAEGARMTLHILQVTELKNGVPVCNVKYENAPKAKAS